jgi:glyoxylase-like metal-dependent hydrolase (beta-lactamase superfamily II)
MFRRYGLFRDLGPAVPADKRFPDDIVQPYGNVLAQLAKRKVAVDTIQHLIFSHLHADHHGMDDARDGGAAMVFSNAWLHVSGRGWQNNLDKRVDGQWNSYVDFAFSDFLLERQRAGRLRCEDNTKIFPGVRTVYLGGHSVCSQAVIVQTSGGPAILASDEVYLYQLLAANVLPALRTSEAKYRQALDRLVNLAVQESGIIIPMHDPIVWDTYQRTGAAWLGELKQISDQAVQDYLKKRSAADKQP